MSSFSWEPFAKIASYAFFVFPLPAIYKGLNQKRYDLLPYINYFSNCVMLAGWAIYGQASGTDAILITSSVGLVCFTVFSSLALILNKKYDLLLVLYISLPILWIVLRAFPINIMGSVVSLVQTASVLTSLGPIAKAWEKKDSDFLNFQSLLLSLPNGYLWTFFGFEIKDPFLVLPNLLDALIISGKILLYFYLKSQKTNVQKENKKK